MPTRILKDTPDYLALLKESQGGQEDATPMSSALEQPGLPSVGGYEWEPTPPPLAEDPRYMSMAPLAPASAPEQPLVQPFEPLPPLPEDAGFFERQWHEARNFSRLSGHAVENIPNVLQGIVRKFQDSYGHDVAEKYNTYVKEEEAKLSDSVLPQNVEEVEARKKHAAGKEVLRRSALMLAGGPAMLEEMPDSTRLIGVNALEDQFGERGASWMLSMAQQVGELPLFFIGARKVATAGEAAVAAAPTAAKRWGLKVGYGALAGAETGAYTAIFMPPRPDSDVGRGMTVAEGTVGGALLGGAFSAMGATWQAAMGSRRVQAWRQARAEKAAKKTAASQKILSDAPALSSEESAVADKVGTAVRQKAEAPWGVPEGKVPLEAGHPDNDAELSRRIDEYIEWKRQQKSGGGDEVDPFEVAALQEAAAEGSTKGPLYRGEMDRLNDTQELVGFLSEEAHQQLVTEVVKWPAKVRIPEMPSEAIGTITMHYTPEEGLHLIAMTRLDATGTPTVVSVPATRENVLRARLAVAKHGTGLTITQEGVQYSALPGIPKESSNLASILMTPYNEVFPSEGRGMWSVEDVLHNTDAAGATRIFGKRVRESTIEKDEYREAVRQLGEWPEGPGGVKIYISREGEFSFERLPSRVDVTDDVARKVAIEKLTSEPPAPAAEAPAPLFKKGRTGAGKPSAMEARAAEEAALAEKSGVAVPGQDVSASAYERTKMLEGVDPGFPKPPKSTTRNSGFANEPPDRKGKKEGGLPAPKQPTPSITPEVPPTPPIENWDVADAAADLVSMEILRRSNKNRKSLGEVLANTFYANHLRGPIAFAAWKTGYQASQILQRSSHEIYSAARRDVGVKLLSDADKALDKFFKGDFGGDAESFVTAWKTTEMKLPEKVRERAREFAFNTLARKEANDRRLAELGFTPDTLAAAREAGMLDAYAMRKYWLNAMPQGEWVKHVMRPGEQWRLYNAVDYLYAQSLKDPNARGLTPETIAKNILTLLKMEDPLGGLRTAIGGSKRLSATKALLKRHEMDRPILDLLGEIDSGMTNIAMTLGTQDSLVARAEWLHEMASFGEEMWSPRINFELGRTSRIPSNPAFGPMAGKYVADDVYDSVVLSARSPEVSNELVRMFVGMQKSNQTAAGGLGPVMNSIFGNLWSGTLAGSLDLYRPRETGKALIDACIALRDFHRDPTGLTGKGGIVTEARKMGADWYGFSHEEIGNPYARRYLEDVTKHFEESGGKEPVSLWTALKHMGTRVAEIHTKAMEHAGILLDLNDQVFRIQAYISLRQKILDDFIKNGPKSQVVREGLLDMDRIAFLEGGLPKLVSGEGRAQSHIQRKAWLSAHAQRNPQVVFQQSQQRAAEYHAAWDMFYGTGKDELPKAANPDVWTALFDDPETQHLATAVAKLATRRINQSFWNPSFIAKPLDQLRRSTVGIATPYATATFESMRINAMAVQRWRARDANGELLEPDLRSRIFATGLAVAGAYGVHGLAREINGISWDEIQDARQNLSPGKRGYRPVTLAIAWRDFEGRVQFLDVSKSFDLFRLLEGNQDEDSAHTRILTNLLLSPTQGGASEYVVRGGLEAANVITPTAKPQDRESTPPTEKFLRWMFNTSLLPGAVRNTYEAARLSDSLPGFLGNRGMTEEELTPFQAGAAMLGWPKIMPSGDDTERGARLRYRGNLRDTKKEMRSIRRQPNMDDDEKDDRTERLFQKRERMLDRGY